ncbi:laminin subunit alpha [Biomphalaria glabrata]|nr:laminin subunit alpha [Biomphalaria glabrata]
MDCTLSLTTKCFHYGWIIATLKFISLCSILAAEPVNVALNKPVTAYYTCGYFGREVYTTMTDAYSSASSRPRRSCIDFSFNQSQVKASYPPEAMVDGRSDTWWQSTSRSRIYYYGQMLAVEMYRKLEAMIDIDLNQEFLMEQITIQLGDALTPQKIAILKSQDNKTFTPWIFAVTVNDRCSLFFNATYKMSPESMEDTICVNYVADDVPPGDSIIIDLTTVPASLKEWTRIRYMKIKLYDMMFVYPFNSLADSYNHYAVAELTAKAECPCNGLQTGCAVSNITGMYECTCGGNTSGRFCESCLPGFNQFAFQYGKPCVECNCFGHSTTCFYKTSVEEGKLSIDKNGARNGGGVCFDCKNNTAGINCEKCVDLYYRPVDRQQTSEDACLPCQCNSSGSTENNATGLVDCVMNNDTPRSDGKSPGQCFCKANVMGPKCSECKPGFYNLQQSNSEGCSNCNCYTSGTVGNSTLCTPDNIGQCNCKANVDGRACDRCKDGFYNLTSDNLLGCTPCNCNAGGSVHQNCDKQTGQCICISQNIQGRICDRVNQGFYYPSSHSIYTELEDSIGDVVVNRNPLFAGFSGRGYAVVGTGKNITFLLTTPRDTDLSNNYIIIVVYRSQVVNNITVKIQTSDEVVINQTLILPACPTLWCQKIGSYSDILSLFPGANLILLRVNSGSALLDKFIALPVELTNVTHLLTSPLPTDCDFVSNIIPTDPTNKTACQKALFSVTMYYWNSPLPCNCDVTGSISLFCDENGGQCQCQQGVTGRTCNKCVPDHYAFTSTGCTACNCTGLSSSCDSGTGQCQCPDNTIGRQCEFCVPNNWNWSKTEGCQDCGCYSAGSVNLQCNLSTGVCQCKVGFEGAKCDSCMNEYYLSINQECSPCLCDHSGSTTKVCNKTTGQCSCKNNTVGRQCSECDVGSFSLGSSPTQDCLKCICMGITSTCGPADVKLSYSLYNLVIKTDSITSTLQLVDETSTNVSLPVRPGTDPKYVGAVVVDVTAAQPQLYWKMPNSFTDNILSLYGSEVNFIVNYINISTSTPLTLNVILLDVKGLKLVSPVKNVKQGENTEHKVTLIEDGWTKFPSGVTVTRGEFLKALSTAKALLIPATFVLGNHTAQLSQLSLGSVSDVGPVNPAVEQCQCGEGYQGRSCEKCAPGYKRVNVTTSDYFGYCVPCECNGHSSLCDPDTGMCQECLNNTAGASCEVCKTGHYGDPVYGCSRCPCYQPRVVNETCHFENSSDGLSSVPVCNFCRPGYIGPLCDSCDANYYGEPLKDNGTCLPCDCNGNSLTCDNITGICNNCSSNTTGIKCEQCMAGFYGNASLKNCQECKCSASNSTVCDNVSGQCSCLPGVEGRDCSYCQANFWSFNSTSGCLPCRCIDQGSQSLQCNNITGLCTCKPFTSGDACDTCADGYYGLPLQPCQACNCNTTGSVAATSCNKTSGQCQCLPGVGGLKCDKCLPFFVNFTTTGCQECGQCQKSFGQDITSLIQVGQTLFNKTKSTLLVQKEGYRLNSLSLKLNESINLLGLAGSNATSVQDIIQNVDSQKRALNSTLQMAKSNVAQLSIAVEQTKSDSDTVLSKFSSMKDISTNLSSSASSFEEKLKNYLLYLEQYNSTASQYLYRNSTFGSVLSFSNENEIVGNFLSSVNSSIGLMSATNTVISQQAVTLERINGTVVSLIMELDSKNMAATNLSTSLDSLSFTTFSLDNIQDQTEAYKAQLETLFQTTDDVLNSAIKMNADILSNLTAARTGVRNTDAIYSGNAAMVMSGPDYLPFPVGVTNFLTGVSKLDYLLTSTPELITNVSANVLSLESQVAVLNESLAVYNSTYLNISTKGGDAVKVITNFETVIRDLSTSGNIAASAHDLMTGVENNLTGSSLELMNSTFTAENDNSHKLRNRLFALSLEYQPEVLKNQLTNALFNLDNEITQWGKADASLSVMTFAADPLNTQLKDKHLSDDLANALAKVQAAESIAQSANTSATERASELNQKQSEIGLLQSQIKRVQDLQTSVENSVASYQGKVSSFKSNLTSASNLITNMDSSIKSVQDKIKLLESKMAEAESLLSRLRKPLTFDGALSLQVKNSESGTAHLYDNVVIDVKKPANFSDGVILFMDSPGTESEFQLGLTSGKMFFKFNTGTQSVNVNSRADICGDCWIRVYATRYANVGHLTVTPLPSGTPVSDSIVGPDSNTKTINLTSDVFIGTLPSDKVTTKVVNREFRGCLFNTQYQGKYLNLWTKAASATTQVKCCDVPPSMASPVSTSGTSFTGWGYAELPPRTIAFSDIIQLSLELRTFSLDATLFSITSSDQATSFTISLTSGYVQLSLVANGIPYILKSNHQYSNGQWTQILVMKSPIELKLVVRKISDQSSLDVKNETVTSIDLSPCNGKNYIFGSNSTIRNGKIAFAGCMRNISLTSNQTTESLSFKDASTAPGVSTDGCFANVINGILFTSQSAYAQLSFPNQLQQVKKLELDLATLEPSGIVLFISSDGALRFLYLALYGGNVIVVYRQNDTATVVSSGHYISDGQVHTIKIDCSTFRVSVNIDGVTFEETSPTLTTDYLSFPSNVVLHIGGKPSVVQLPEFPTVVSLVGGISRLLVNDGSISLTDTTFHADVSYAGVPVASTTQLMTASTQSVSCASPPIPSYLSYSEGFLMTGMYDISFNDHVMVSSIVEYLETGFSINLDIAIYKADGVLLYVADIIKDPSYYFTIFIMDGVVNLHMKTSSNTDLQVVLTKSIKDGHRISISVLRINDYIAIKNDLDNDYQNTKLSPNITTQFPVPNTNKVYLGGLGVYDLSTSPLPQVFHAQPEKVMFAGAVYSVKVSRTLTDNFYLKIDTLNRTQFPAVPSKVSYGVTLSGVNSYLGLGLVSTLGNFSMTLRLSTTSSSGLLFVLQVTSSTYYVALDWSNNQLNFYLAPSFQGFVDPLVIPLDSTFNVCDGNMHDVSLQLDTNSVTLSVDSVLKSKMNIPASHALQPMTNATLFVGGLKDSSLTLPPSLSKASLSACVQSVTLTRTETTALYDPTQYAASSSGTSYGCPYI